MSLLNWRRPDPERLDHDESALWIASGFSGYYRIQPDLENFIVWLDDDEFAFETFSTVDECKTFAEKRFRDKVVELNDRLTDLILMEGANEHS